MTLEDYKEPLRLSNTELTYLNETTKEILTDLEKRYPDARKIDLLNSFLRAFTQCDKQKQT